MPERSQRTKRPNRKIEMKKKNTYCTTSGVRKGKNKGSGHNERLLEKVGRGGGLRVDMTQINSYSHRLIDWGGGGGERIK